MKQAEVVDVSPPPGARKQEAIMTVDHEARAVRDRLGNPEVARQIYQRYRQALIDVHRADARVMALHRGVAPYDDAELRGLGQGWRANLNLREMKGIINHRADTTYDLHMEVGNRIKVTVRPEYQEYRSPNPLAQYGEIIAEEYTHMLNVDWPENYLLLDQVSRDRIKLGLGVACWPDEWDWRPVRMPKYSFFTDPKFPPLADSIPCCVVRDTLLLQDILPKLEPENAEAAKMAGWNVEELRAVVLQFYKATTDSNATTEPPSVRDDVIGQWAAFEAWRASRPAEVAVFELESIPVVRYLIKSVTGPEVSHYIDIDPAMGTYQPEDFIFKKLEQFEKMSQAIWLNPFNYSEGTIGSVDGLGHDLAPYCEISNRMLNTALDGGMLSGGLVLQAQQGWDADEMSVVRIGPTTLIPPGLQAINSAFAPPIERLLDLRMAVRGVYSNNVGMTRMNPEQMEVSARGTRSTEEVISERRREFRIEANAANFEYMMWTNLHREIFRRAVILSKKSGKLPGAKEAKAFRERCLRRNVPEILFDKFEDALVVEVNRAIGGGSPEARETTWGKLMGLRGSMDEAGRRYVERQFVSALIGYKNVDNVFPLGTRDQIPTNEKSIATLENNDFREGAYVPAGSDQLHTAHLAIHFELLGGMVQSYDQPQEGKPADPEAILRTFSAALPNCEEHIRFLAADESRKDFVRRASGMLKELVVFYRRVEKEAQQNADQRQRLEMERQQQVMQELENRMSGETAVKLREVELKAQLEAMKQESLNAVRAAKTAAQNEIKRWGAEMRSQLDREIAERKMALEEEVARRKADLADYKRAD